MAFVGLLYFTVPLLTGSDHDKKYIDFLSTIHQLHNDLQFMLTYRFCYKLAPCTMSFNSHIIKHIHAQNNQYL